MAKFFSYQTGGKTCPEYWLKLFKSGKDKWFSAEEAYGLGIVHRIIKKQDQIGQNSLVRKPFEWDIISFSQAQSS
jgi:hypothetical protein